MRQAIWARTFWAPAHTRPHLHISAGRYMCGEETGLLNALEGRRANPRAKPPFPPRRSLGQAHRSSTTSRPSEYSAYRAQRRRVVQEPQPTDDGGTKLYGVSGRVKHPGRGSFPWARQSARSWKSTPAACAMDTALRGLLPGGASTDFLLEEHLDVPMDFGR